MTLDWDPRNTALSAQQAERPAEGALRGLTTGERDRDAASVLAAVAWEGLVPDPDALSAASFLALL